MRYLRNITLWLHAKRVSCNNRSKKRSACLFSILYGMLMGVLYQKDRKFWWGGLHYYYGRMIKGY